MKMLARTGAKGESMERNLRKNKCIVIRKPNKGNGVVILDRKLDNKAIEEVISDIF